MATVNNRLKTPRAITINGVDAGGAMSAVISSGFDNQMYSAPDGLQLPVKDKETQFVRGTITTQDWLHAIDLLTGAVGTLVFYERKSGVAAATGYIKHTINNPVIYSMDLNFQKGGYATATFNFECKAADETEGIADMWAITDSQPAPGYISAARGGYRVRSCAHGSLDINHVMNFSFKIAMPLDKACNDGDVAYTCVEARLEGMRADGSISFQDGDVTTGKLVCQQLALASTADLVIEVTQGQGAAAKTITIANVDFNGVGSSSDVNASFTGYTAEFDVANDAGTPLTLEDTNKIITIA